MTGYSLRKLRVSRRSVRDASSAILRVGFAVALSLHLAGCGREGGSAADLEAAVQRSISLMNVADWDTAYEEVLTNAQRAACSAKEYAESEGAGLESLRETVGAGELGVIELTTEVVGEVGLVMGTIIYTSQHNEQLETEGEVSGAGLVARRNLGTATAENPDYWVFENGAWRWVQRRPDSPCFNEADLKAIEAVQQRLGAESQD